MKPCKFTFDDGPQWDGFDHESTWNGFDNVAVNHVVRAAIGEWMIKSAFDKDSVAEEVHDLMLIEPIEGTRLYSLGWGYATTIVREEPHHPDCPATDGFACRCAGLPDNDVAAKLIADRFVTILRAWLDPQEWRLMGARNALETDALVCHSHDFCDANMAMCEAYESVTGKTPDADNAAEATLWGTAWANAMPCLTLYTAEWKDKA